MEQTTIKKLSFWKRIGLRLLGAFDKNKDGIVEVKLEYNLETKELKKEIK